MTYPTPTLMEMPKTYRLPCTWSDYPQDSIPTPTPRRAEIRVLDIRAKKAVNEDDLVGPLEFVPQVVSLAMTDLQDFKDRLESELGSVSVTQNPRGPYDIDVTRQCWVGLILNPGIDWRFVPGSPGVTTKDFYGSDNFGVTFVTGTQGAFRHSNPSTDRNVPLIDPDRPETFCRALYFTVARRRPDGSGKPQHHSRQGFNFHIEFFGIDSSGQRWILPVIFDPNVPDGGGASIP